MAKNNFSKHAGGTAGTAIKVISVLIALILAAYVVLSLVYHSWNPVRWTDNNQTQTDTDNDPDKDKPGDTAGTGGAFISDGESHGAKLMSAVIPVSAYAANGISEQADTAFVITAKCSPVGASDIFDWAISGNDDEAVTLTPMGMSAKVVCNKAFAVQKVITITSRTNSEVTASCTVDYYKRLQSVSVNAPTTIKLNLSATEYSVSLEPVYGIGTVLDTTITMGSISIKTTYNDNLFGHCSYARSDDGSEAKPTATVTGEAGTGKFSLIMSPTERSSFFELTCGAGHVGTYAAYYKWFIDECSRDCEHYEISVSWSATRNGGTFDSGTATVRGKFDVSDLKIDADNVIVSPPGIIFNLVQK